MKNINKEGEQGAENSDEKQVRKLVMFAAVGLKLGRQILEKLQAVEDSIEIVAREIKKQTDNGK